MNCSGKQWIGGVPAQWLSTNVEGPLCLWLAPFPILNCFSLHSVPEDGGRQTTILILSAMKTTIPVMYRHCVLCSVGAMHSLSGHTAPSDSDVIDVYCTAAFRQDAPGGCPGTGPDHCDPKFSYFSCLILSVIRCEFFDCRRHSLCFFVCPVSQSDVVTDDENTRSSPGVWILSLSALHCVVTVRLTFNSVRTEWRKLQWGFQLRP